MREKSQTNIFAFSRYKIKTPLNHHESHQVQGGISCFDIALDNKFVAGLEGGFVIHGNTLDETVLKGMKVVLQHDTVLYVRIN